MANCCGILRIVLHVVCGLLTVAAIAVLATALLTTTWDYFEDDGNVHQHGLWFDYTYQPLEGKGTRYWQMSLKFGKDVENNPLHRWEPYQYNTLALLMTVLVVSFISLGLSCGAMFHIAAAAVWVFMCLVSAALSVTGVIIYTLATMDFDKRHVHTGSVRVQQHRGLAFQLAVAAANGYCLIFLLSIVAAIVDVILLRRGERPSLSPSYVRVSTRSTTTTHHHATKQHNTEV